MSKHMEDVIRFAGGAKRVAAFISEPEDGMTSQEKNDERIFG